jgi:Secretion system C-terminal sorting domain
MVLVAVVTHAQTISGYRYWFDDDAASASTQAVAGVTDLALATTWPAASLAPGYHRVTVQFQDSDGDWSAPETSVFVRSAGPVSGYRYWVNDDVSTLVTASVTAGNEVVANTALTLPTLATDFNTITVQFRDDIDEWSVPYTTVFTKGTGAVNGYEYWIDDAIASSTSGSIGPSNTVDLIADLPTGTTSGTHLFTIRFSSANGTWTVPLTSEFSFFTTIPELPGVSEALLFPNPTNGQLTVRLTSASAMELRVAIVDATGRVVRTDERWDLSGTGNFSWELDELAPGPYAVRVCRGKEQHMLRFMKR